MIFPGAALCTRRISVISIAQNEPFCLSIFYFLKKCKRLFNKSKVGYVPK